jgi:AcrR family transcriptional regulator
MSSHPRTTRERILAAALDLVEQGQGQASMGAIAKAAGLSRQALYLIFADRTDLFVALARYVDERRGIEQEIAGIEAAPNGVDALLAMVDLQARDNPGLKPIADAFEVLRRRDPDAEKAWQDRLDYRLHGCRAIVARIAAEGRLRAGLKESDAADLVWTLTSLRTWDELVAQRGWSEKAYREQVGWLLLAAIVA